MNEADKERYFREKEAYERVTGQVLPVAKVVRGNLHLGLSHFVSIFPMSKVVRGNLHLNLSHFVSIFPMSKVVRKSSGFPIFLRWFPPLALHCKMLQGPPGNCNAILILLIIWFLSFDIENVPFFKDASELGVVGPAYEMQSGRMNIAGFTSSSEIASLASLSSPATSVWCSTATGSSRTGSKGRTREELPAEVDQNVLARGGGWGGFTVDWIRIRP